MATVKNTYATPTTGTGGITSLATSSTWVAGYEWFYVDNSSNLYTDYRISGKIRVGSSGITANTEIRIYLVASDDNSTWPDVFDGTPSTETVTSEGVRDGFAKLAASLRVDSTTASRDYPFEFSAAEVFGGSVPKGFVAFVTHNTAANLDSTAGNHTYSYAGQYLTVT